MEKVERVLIISIKAGAGHLRAAQALEQEFATRHPGIEVLHLDVLEYTNAAFSKGFTETYEMLARELPSVWGLIYESMEKQSVKSRLKKAASLFDRLNGRKLRKAVKQFKPDRIICTHYVPAEILAPQRRKGKLDVPLFVTLTDYDIHTMWIQDGVDRYFVATEEMAYALKAKGIGNAEVSITGIPILPEFSRKYPGKAALRKKLGLSPDATTVLMSAGGFGLIPADKLASVLAEKIDNVQFVAVAGKNSKLEKGLRKAAEKFPGKIQAHGFVNNMHELMAASDFAIAKSGGLTTSECLALGVPMVIIKPIPGQEERNATYLLENGAGVWAQASAHLIYKTEKLIADPKKVRKMQAAAQAIARPDAARDIVRCVMAG